MDEFLGTIIPIVLIVASILGGFSKDKKKSQTLQKRTRYTDGRTTSRPQGIGSLVERANETIADWERKVQQASMSEQFGRNARNTPSDQNVPPTIILESLGETDWELLDPQQELLLDDPELPARLTKEQSLDQPTVETAPKREVDEAEEYWKNPQALTARQVPQTAQKDAEADLLPKTPQDILRAVVMSEVLQPPRSRRPYRPIYLDQER